MKKLLLIFMMAFILCGCGGAEEIGREDDQLLKIYSDCAGVRQDRTAYLEKLGQMGFCAGDKSGDFDMVNTDKLEGFFRGEAESAEFIMLCHDGGFEYITLTADRIKSSRVAEAAGEARITWQTDYELAHMEYTDKGWLIMERIMPDNPRGGNHDGWVEPTLIYRIKPMDEALRQACKKYIEPIGYGTNGFFMVDWDGENMENISFSGLFPAAYSIYYGRDLIYYESPYPIDESATRAWVAADEFENIMLPLFDITKDELRSLALFDGEKYEVSTVRTMDEKWYDVFPEVTGITENADGTLTLTVDALSQSLKTDRAFSHTVTLRDEGERVVYLENNFEPGK